MTAPSLCALVRGGHQQQIQRLVRSATRAGALRKGPVPKPNLSETHSRATFELECIDRLSLNGYVPSLQTPDAVAHFLRGHRGAKFASSVLLDEIGRDCAQRSERFVRQEDLAVCRFAQGERKDDETQRRLRAFERPEGVLYLGTAQKKVYYGYVVDEDFGPLFLEFGSYFPYPVKVCLNGHEFLQRQLAKAGVACGTLDNSLLSCADAALAPHGEASPCRRGSSGILF